MCCIRIQCGPIGLSDPTPPTSTARKYYSMFIIPRNAANNWPLTTTLSFSTSSSTESTFAGAFAARLACIGNHGYIHPNDRTCI